MPPGKKFTFMERGRELAAPRASDEANKADEAELDVAGRHEEEEKDGNPDLVRSVMRTRRSRKMRRLALARRHWALRLPAHHPVQLPSPYSLRRLMQTPSSGKETAFGAPSAVLSPCALRYVPLSHNSHA